MPENVAPRSGAPAAGPGSRGKGAYQDRDKPAQIRFSNISAAKGLSRLLGPVGRLFKALLNASVEAFGHAPLWVLVIHSVPLQPCTVFVTLLVELSKAQDIEAGDGTTSVVIIAGSLLDSCTKLLQKVMKVIDPATATSVDLRDIKIVKKLGGTIDDCELVEGLVLTQKVANSGISRVEKAKIGLIQFCLSAPKTDTIGTKPVAHIDQFTTDMLGSAELAEEVNLNGSGKLFKITGCTSPGKTVTIVVRGSNKLVIEEAERSIHDALCVIRCLVKKRALIAGGGAPEIELALRLTEYSRTLSGMESYCVRAFADAMEVIPSTLAENAGLNPISTVTELRNRHAQGEKTTGINVRKGGISNILEEMVVQPLLVSVSALTLATETVRSILKIDDVVRNRD
ncbi:T-complex protein 1 subunit delta [Cricetulus griseus]|uniref:T-complex protein 1 subunit delta n=1 Tax=Cricetulus griseus TaxID=10029 RepID=G3HDR3_CRIGR|nr:T-complex protein 1 subunit delta [Cricetulus griseus]